MAWDHSERRDDVMLSRNSAMGLSLVVAPAAANLSSTYQAQGASSGPTQWIWALIILAVAVVLAALVCWWLTRAAEESEIAPRAAATIADDLTRIEGIGPKISGLLQGAGISTFEHLANAGVDRLEQILDAADLSGIANPGTWPEQAALAAKGDWGRLEALQNELKGGRRA
jgi:hypothetical protein